MPALLAVSASEGINVLRNTPSVFETLQANVHAAHAILDKLDCITIPSHPASPVIHIYVRSPPPDVMSPTSAKFHTNFVSPKDAVRLNEFNVEERLLQEVAEDCLAQGVIVTRSKRLRGQEMVEPKPSIRLAMSSALTRKETEKAVGVLKSSLVKILSRRR